MGNRKIIIIALAALVLIAIAAFFIQKAGKKNPDIGTDQTNTQTGTGGLGNLPTGTTNQGRSFAVISDPSQPYVTILPRASETDADNNYKPATADNNQNSGGLSYQQQYDLGLAPDENGEYKQVIDPSGTNQYQANQKADYALSDEQFLQKYYPDYLAFNAGTTPEQIAQDAKDPVVIDTPSAADVVDSPTVDSSQFTVSSSNTTTAITAYINKLSDATKDFDLIYNNDLVLNGLDLNTLDEAQGYYDKVAATANAIRAVPVPSSMLAFSKSYLHLYELYAAVLNDEKALIKNPKATNPVFQTYATDAQAFTDQLSSVMDNINVVKSITQ